jgi:hypothetical protein
MRGEISICVGKGLRDLRRYTPQFGLRLSHTRALFQPAEHPPSASSARGVFRRRLQSPKVLGGFGCKRELFRHDANNLCGLVVDLDRSSHNVGIASEPALPKAVTHHDDGGALFFFFLCERSPQSRHCPQDGKEAGRCQCRADSF